MTFQHREVAYFLSPASDSVKSSYVEECGLVWKWLLAFLISFALGQAGQVEIGGKTKLTGLKARGVSAWRSYRLSFLAEAAWSSGISGLIYLKMAQFHPGVAKLQNFPK
jgi:hypothetical protein